MNQNKNTFINECRSINSHIMLTDESNLKKETHNISGFERKIAGVINPLTTKELEQVIRLANQFQIPLYPYSTGRNWGFGSKLPCLDGSFTLDLSALNHIREYNPKHGYVVIEPGVTQRQLSEFLEQQNSNFYLDVTGSSADTSIIGNALERGIAYNSLRVNSVNAIEVLTASGEYLHTGFSQWKDSLIKNLYRSSLGPSVDSLFFQSNFGIVTAMTYQLFRKPEHEIFINFNFPIENLETLIEKIRELKQTHPWDAIIHIANRGRSQLLIQKLVQVLIRAKTPGKNISDQEALKSFNRQFKYEWIAIGSIKGPEILTKTILKKLKSSINNLGLLRTFTTQDLKLAKKLTQWIGKDELHLQLEIAGIMSGLSQGRATNATLQTYFSPLHEFGTDHPLAAKWIDQSNLGFVYCVPLAPLEGKYGTAMIELAKKICDQYQFTAEITLNTITSSVVEAVISISFDKQNTESTTRAHSCIRKLTECMIAEGFYPYRLPIELMGILDYETAQQDLFKQLKNYFDPKKIISQGRYT
jgi:4-cresol dehydrogenase (hydroxylating)